ncbi:L,D-transpeptidase family protein [Sulfurovum sp. XGS-02]|uniref:L,D-transpeptidase family protein n=1 Tax=Sulfurovum sp. XGS-02 TaxID=2925411 RepID=UPI00206B8BD7|nr:L,D-transpeptidase family protein [Sulfurovum sp. XGS-02]UPT78148.1 L,D-transpeptidase family protein [Sulfurovum sp. XGS-02]
MKKIMMLIFSGVSAIVLSGCGVETPDAEGWRPAQKEEFLEILETDKYASICNQQALYEKVKESENSKLMSKLLVSYAKNLANGCIDLESFNASQEKRVEQKVATYYETYLQEVKASDIMRQLKAGQSIEAILKPYVPEYAQFFDLQKRYRLLGGDKNTSKKTLRKIRLNLERLKLMKPGLGDNYALVNIPEYTVRVIDANGTAMAMAVVVGQRKMQTPVFSADLSYVTLNPQWGVPDSIARNEVIPKLLEDPNYLVSHNMVIRKSYDLNTPEVSQDSVDWEAYLLEEKDKEEMTYKFIEVPSKKNGLGRVKFIFPNKHSVYMHDTQSKHLFKRKVRTYSHGCVRLEKPMAMLEHISKNYTEKTSEEVKEWYDSLETHHMGLVKKLPVHTAYLTTYVDECGKLLVFNDIYGFDKSQKLNF